MKNYARESRPWLIWLTIFAVIAVGVGAYFYYTLFRQSKSELIEAIPTDAAFVFALNDNDGFVSSTAMLTPYLNELFVMDALPAYETMRGKLPAGEYDLTVSGHTQGNTISLLFNMHADKAAFKRLLRALSIDPNNYTAFENNRIYTYGTNFKSMKFVYLNHIISFSSDIELLKRAIVQHAHPKNLLSNKQFKEVYQLTEKNRKQNWLIINPSSYMSYLSSFLKEESANKLSDGMKKAGWTAFQLRFSGNEMHFSGYMLTDNPDSEDFEFFVKKAGDGMTITNLYPANIDWYTHLETPKAHDFKSKKLFDDPQTTCDLAPSEIGYFSLRSDSTEYRYAILLPNGEKSAMEILYKDAHRADSARAAHPDGLFPTPQPVRPLLKAFAPDSATWFIEKEDALVFADSKEALKLYQSQLKSAGGLTQNRLYPFVNDAVASSSILNYVLFNDASSTFLNSCLTEKGKASITGQNLRILSFSCETMDKEKSLLPVNLFLHF